MRIRILFALFLLLPISSLRADEQLFGFVRGAETLPANRSEIYPFVTLHEGKSEGTYVSTDFETEYEYAFTDRFQSRASGWFIVDEVVGKHEFITYAVGLNSD
jgi:hypothetical protein